MQDIREEVSIKAYKIKCILRILENLSNRWRISAWKWLEKENNNNKKKQTENQQFVMPLLLPSSDFFIYGKVQIFNSWNLEISYVAVFCQLEHLIIRDKITFHNAFP